VPPLFPATAFVGQKSILRQVVLAPNVETTWGTPVAAASFTEAVAYDVSGYAKFAQPKESTYGQAGKTNSFADQNWTVQHKCMLELSGTLTDWLAGYLLAMALGRDVVTGSAAPYTHALNFLDSSTIAQATTIYAQDTQALAYQLVDMGLSQLTITSSGTGSLKFKATFLGTGRTVDGALSSMPTPVQRQRLYGSDSQILMGVSTGAYSSMYPRVKSWELTIDAGIAEERPSGSGLYASHLTVSMPKVKFKFVVAANSADDFYGWKRNGTQLGLTCNTNSGGGTSALNITLPNFTLDENCALSDAGGESVWTVDLGENDILQIGVVPCVTATVVNSQPSYLVAA
jgi:hypothetical protein